MVNGKIEQIGLRHLFTPCAHGFSPDLLPALEHDMANGTDEPFPDSLAESLDMGTPSIILVHHDHLVRVLSHSLADDMNSCHVHGQRLFAEDMFARP